MGSDSERVLRRAQSIFAFPAPNLRNFCGFLRRIFRRNM